MLTAINFMVSQYWMKVEPQANVVYLGLPIYNNDNMVGTIKEYNTSAHRVRVELNTPLSSSYLTNFGIQHEDMIPTATA
jgi:hypothetical protein